MTRTKARPAPITRRPGRPVVHPAKAGSRCPYPLTNADCPRHNSPVYFDPATKGLFCPSCTRVTLA